LHVTANPTDPRSSASIGGQQIHVPPWIDLGRFTWSRRLMQMNADPAKRLAVGRRIQPIGGANDSGTQ
jgi:hypothetical protein